MKSYPFILLAASFLASSRADTITLKDGDRLTGEVLSIMDGLVSLQSSATAHSSKPLQIRKDALKKITFRNTTSPPVSHSEFITLKNGDTIPCSVLSLSDSELTLDTWFTGELHLPRTSLSTVQFGIEPEKVVFQDDHDLSQWLTEDGQWDVISEKENGIIQKKYACLGRGSISREINTPSNINISYDLEWETSINFTFKFCADNKGPVDRQSAYHLFINYAGINVTRYQGESIEKLIHNEVQVNSLKKKKINISINLNKESGEVNVLINNRSIGASAYDTLDPAEGHYMVFNMGSGDGCRISNLKITELAANSNFQVDTLSGADDLLIDYEANQLKGTVQFIKKATTADKNVISFLANDSPDQALEIPQHRVDTLYFGRTDEEDAEVKTSLTASILGKGKLQLNDVKITDQKITGKHPYLGDCEIDIKSISSLQYQSAE